VRRTLVAAGAATALLVTLACSGAPSETSATPGPVETTSAVSDADLAAQMKLDVEALKANAPQGANAAPGQSSTYDQFMATWEFETIVFTDLTLGKQPMGSISTAYAYGQVACATMRERGVSADAMARGIKESGGFELSGADAIVVAAVRDLCKGQTPYDNHKTYFDDEVVRIQALVAQSTGVTPEFVATGWTAKISCAHLDKHQGNLGGLRQDLFAANLIQTDAQRLNGWIGSAPWRQVVYHSISYRCQRLGGASAYWSQGPSTDLTDRVS
jgi:hypothetical protein